MLTRTCESVLRHYGRSKARNGSSDSGQNVSSTKLERTGRKTCCWPPRIDASRLWKRKIVSSKRNSGLLTVSSMSKCNRKEAGSFMTKPTGGVFPLHEDVLKEEARAEYRQHMDTFFLRLAELNINIYIVEQVLAFPYDLLAEGRTDDGFFFPLLVKNTFEACTLMVAKVATDQGSDVYTLPRLRNMLLQMVKPEHQPEIQARLGGLRFDQKTRELLEKARKLRDTHIAHFVHAASQEQLTLSEIKALRDELNTL